MKLLLFPPVDEKRLHKIQEAAGTTQVVNAVDAESAGRAATAIIAESERDSDFPGRSFR